MPAAQNTASNKALHYIESLPDWSRTLCLRLRRVILDADPGIAEEWKWGPHYAHHGMVCGLGAFQKHIKLTFFNGAALKDGAGLFNHCTDNAFSRSIKYTADSTIDEPTLTLYVQEAVAVNRNGFKRVVRDKTVEVPDDLLQALKADKKALSFFNDLSYGYKKEFVEQVTTAKQEKTRLARIAKVVHSCANGKKLNDHYKK